MYLVPSGGEVPVANGEFSTRLKKASEIGLKDWPEEFEYEGKTWEKDHVTTAQRTGEVQCAEYRQKGENNWLVVTNE